MQDGMYRTVQMLSKTMQHNGVTVILTVTAITSSVTNLTTVRTAVDIQLQTDMVALILTEIPIPMLTLVASTVSSHGTLIQMV